MDRKSQLQSQIIVKAWKIRRFYVIYEYIHIYMI